MQQPPNTGDPELGPYERPHPAHSAGSPVHATCHIRTHEAGGGYLEAGLKMPGPHLRSVSDAGTAMVAGQGGGGQQSLSMPPPRPCSGPPSPYEVGLNH